MKSRWLRVLIFIIGFLLCVYPLFSSAYQSWQQGQLIRSFESKVDQMDETDIDSIWKETEKYNSMLFQTQGLSIGSIDAVDICFVHLVHCRFKGPDQLSLLP